MEPQPTGVKRGDARYRAGPARILFLYVFDFIVFRFFWISFIRCFSPPDSSSRFVLHRR